MTRASYKVLKNKPTSRFYGPEGRNNKAKILETACNLFYLRGYNGTSIDDILKAAKVKKEIFTFTSKAKKISATR